jgi:hypothetical protein
MWPSIEHARAVSPGGTSSKSKRLRSPGREFSLAFHQITRAIDPRLSLRHLVQNWNQMAAELSESSRKRESQEQNFCKTS